MNDMTERTLREQIEALKFRHISGASANAYNVAITEVLAILDARTAAQPAPERNWTEDYTRENGNYVCICWTCKQEFIGHKRRATCKACAAAQPAPDAVAEAAERVTRYLRRHKQSRDAAYENIHSYDASPDGGFYLLASDLEILVAIAKEPRT